MMHELVEQLKYNEGFRGEIYQCSAGANTIGYGHNLDSNPIKIKEYKAMGLEVDHSFTKVPMTQEQAVTLLICDLEKYISAVNKCLPDIIPLLNEPRKGVLYDMAFNLGVPGLMKFSKFLSWIIQGEYLHASNEMLKSKWATQVGPRALRLSIQMRIGEWV